MAEGTSEESRIAGSPGPYTTVELPESQAQAVIDFVASLQNKDTEVGGYMLSLGLGMTFTTHTGCTTTSGGDPGHIDSDCTDDDTPGPHTYRAIG